MPHDDHLLLPALDPRRSAPDQPLPVPGWFHTPFIGFLVFGLTLALAGFVGGAVVMRSGRAPVWQMALVELFATVVAYLVLVRWHERRRRPVELAPRRAAGLLVGAALGAVGILAVFGICWAAGWRRVDGVDPHAHIWLPILVAGLVAGVSEELIFRGALFRLAESGLGTWGATLLSGAVFGAAHLTNPNATWWGAVAIALEAGVVFALLYALTRSLWLVIGLHAAWNIVQGPVLGSSVSGVSSAGSSLVVSHPAGPHLWSGGSFGLEASLVSVLCWLPFAGWLAWQLVRRGRVVPPWWVRRRQEAVTA